MENNNNEPIKENTTQNHTKEWLTEWINKD
jgi:hypothetical protein